MTFAYEVLADAFLREGVDTVFLLTGDGNMKWEAALARTERVRSIHVRHEHAACAMASAYALATGRVGVASVTCGPGLTQLGTALATAVRGRIPLVVFAGETPLSRRSYEQDVDQAAFVRSTQARYISVHSPDLLQFRVAEAFLTATLERCPVVIAVPFDLQSEKFDPRQPYQPSRSFLPDTGPRVPHPDYVELAAARVREAGRVVIVAGRGATGPGVREACLELARVCDAAVATTLPARGLFAGESRCIGVAGGYSHPATREALAAADLVIAVGASLTRFTTDSNRLFGAQKVIQIDEAPRGMVHGQATATTYVAADALLGVEALTALLIGSGHSPPDPRWNVQDYARRVRDEKVDPVEYPVPSGTVDPRAVISVLDREIPRDWQYVNSAGHHSFFTTHMHDRDVANFLTIREFGAVGNGLSYAIGMAAARPERPTVLFEGDGGLMMHVQELETVQRYGFQLLICVLNDGAFGSEIHRLRAENLNDDGGVYGRNDIARVARGFGLRGHTVTSLDQLPSLVHAFRGGDTSTVLDIQISDRVLSPPMARQIGGATSGV